MNTKSIHSRVADQIYDFVDENDWSEGLELYQKDRIDPLFIMDSLVTAKIRGNDIRPQEVRTKIHENGKILQWIECSCQKNRRLGKYCEHIIAFLLHLEKGSPSSLAANLHNITIPKPPHTPKARKAALSPQPPSGADKRSFLSSCTIHSVNLIDGGPMLRVRAEVKKDILTHYDLNIDDAAVFLSTQPDITGNVATESGLAVIQTPVFIGTRITQDQAGNISAERGIGFKTDDETYPPSTSIFEKLSTINAKAITFDSSSDSSEYFFLSLDAIHYYLGQQYVFLPKIGYCVLPAQKPAPIWHDSPLRKTYLGDQAVQLILSRYKEQLDIAPVLLDPDLDSSCLVADPVLSSIEILREEHGWFFISPMYESGSTRITMADLIKYSKDSRRNYLHAGRKWYKIPQFIREIDWQLDDDGKSIKASSIDIMRLRAATGDFDRFVGTKKILEHLRAKTVFDEQIDIPSLHHTQLNLREYQVEGTRWLWWLYQNNMHGLLADEMGLGKTHQAMAVLSAIQSTLPQAKFLIVCPTSVLDHWYDKISQFAPNLNPSLHHGQKRHQDTMLMSADSRAIITSYGIIVRDIHILRNIAWDAIVLDEAHFAKNAATATYKAIGKLMGRFRLCMSGTPMENHLGELKNIFDFILPGFLGSTKYFRQSFQNPIESQKDPIAEQSLQRLIHPFKLRRTKKEVLKDLPPKIEDIRHCHLSPEQAGLYREIIALRGSALIKQLTNQESPVPYLHVFATLSLLKQICNHPALVIPHSNYKNHSSHKFDMLTELVGEVMDADLKLVIFSQYVKMIAIIDDFLTEKKIGHVVLTGSTVNRSECINTFQNNPGCRVFLGSLMAGGIGIDLTAASVVIHYDRWWNASKENQATDRVHRIGQVRPVQVFKFITKGTLEEKIDLMIAQKRNIVDKFIDSDEELFKNLDRRTLIELLQ